MQVHPLKHLPIFVYGTLKDGGEYNEDVHDFFNTSAEAYVTGQLYYKIFLKNKEEKDESITAAYSPEGNNKIKGTLFTINDGSYYDALLKMDELEFNFDLNDTREDNKNSRLRTYVRSLVTCYAKNGEAFIAWCYLFHPFHLLPRKNKIQPDENNIVEFDRKIAQKLLNSNEVERDRL